MPLMLPSTPEARAPAISAALTAIKESDPAFDAGSLMRKLPARYLSLRRAAVEGDSDRLRLWLTPALLERGAPAAPLAAGGAETGHDLSVQEVRLVWAERLLWEDRLVAGIDCLFNDAEELRTLTQYWTLARRRGLLTPGAPPPDECPGCGAPVGSGTEICRYCGSALPGPLLGWLLDSVDEVVDWYDVPPGFVV
jgi:hypothetical protein